MNLIELLTEVVYEFRLQCNCIVMIANTTTRSWKSASSGAKSEEIAEAGDFRYVFGAVVRVAHVFSDSQIYIIY